MMAFSSGAALGPAVGGVLADVSEFTHLLWMMGIHLVVARWLGFLPLLVSLVWHLA